MVNIIQKYQEILSRLNKADEYFQTKYLVDTEENKIKAVEMVCKLIKRANELHVADLTYEADTLTARIDIKKEYAGILERLDTIQSDGWKVDKINYLKESEILEFKLRRCKK